MSDRPYHFLNPYNFVRFARPCAGAARSAQSPAAVLLGRCPPPPHDRWVGLSGRIECELEAVSPLFVADAGAWFASDGEQGAKHRTYRFFQHTSVDGIRERTIPASSLRGVIRNVFEAVTDSCMAHFDYDSRLSHRVRAEDSLKLVPARLEHVPRSPGDRDTASPTALWHVRLLPGAARVAVGQRPRGALYAARVERYAAIRPAGRNRYPLEQVALDGFTHGSECFAVIEQRSSLPIWDVKALGSDLASLLSAHPGKRVVRGVLVISNQNIETKRYERFFFSESKPSIVSVSIQTVQRYRELVEDYRARHADDVAKARSAYRVDGVTSNDDGAIKKGAGEPAFSRMIAAQSWQLHDKDLVYVMLSGTDTAPTVEHIVPVAISRVGYDRKLWELLPEHVLKCDTYDGLCPACRVFGWVFGRGQGTTPDEDRRVAYAGRLKFTHGTLSAPVEPLPPTRLATLSAPKPTTTRFYLMPKEGPPRNGQDDWQAGYDNPQNILRGRKLYRHHGLKADKAFWTAEEREHRAKAEPSDQNRTAHDPLPPGTKFGFAIEFENMSEVELGALCWVLEMDRRGLHRLGYAKSFGFGSARLKITGIERLLPHVRYAAGWADGRERVADDDWRAWIELFKAALAARFESAWDDLSHIQDLMALVADRDAELPVHYPRTQRERTPEFSSRGNTRIEGRNYEWFMGNSRMYGPKRALGLPGQDEGLPLIDRQGN